MAALQLVTNAFLSYATNGSFSITVDMKVGIRSSNVNHDISPQINKAFPTYTKANLIDASLLAGLFYPLALSFFIPIFVYAIVLEKQLGLSEMMHLVCFDMSRVMNVRAVVNLSVFVDGDEKETLLVRDVPLRYVSIFASADIRFKISR